MINRLLCCLLLVLLPHISEATLLLREQLAKGVPGDFVVTLQNKSYTLLHVFSKQEDQIIIEEITLPEYRKPKTSWREWVASGASGHTSWVMYEVDLSRGDLGDFFSFTRNGWLDIPSDQNFLSKLLRLELAKVPDTERRRRGRPSATDRPLWSPRLIAEGQPITGVPFQAYRAQWPRDGSELSGKKVLLYLPSRDGAYPTYFPYWIEVDSGVARAHLQLVDSGRQLTSPRSGIPSRTQAEL